MIFDPHVKTIKIPIKVVDGQIRLYPSGKLLPDLAENSIGELTVSASALTDQELTKRFSEIRNEILFSVGTILIAEVKPEGLSPELRKYIKEYGSWSKLLGIEFELLGDLCLKMRGSTGFELKKCRCFIPSLNMEAKSVNHAYTLISQVYEPQRISHTGNVFDKVYYLRDENIHALREKRDKIIAKLMDQPLGGAVGSGIEGD